MKIVKNWNDFLNEDIEAGEKMSKENVVEIYDKMLNGRASIFIKNFPTNIEYDEALMDISDWTGEPEDFDPSDDDVIALLRKIDINFDEDCDINDWYVFFDSLIVTDWYVNDFQEKE